MILGKNQSLGYADSVTQKIRPHGTCI